MRGVVTFCVDHPKLINLLMVVVALLGVLSFKSARYEITPEMNMGVVNITTTKSGAGPEEIELAVTLVLEEELLKVDGVKKVYSKSLENMSLITLHLDQDAEDKTQVINEVQQALDRAQTRLPKDLLEKPRLDELGSNNFGVMEVHLTGAVSESLLRDMARVLEKKLRTLPGIAGVDMYGYRKPEVEMQIDPNKRLQLGISSSEVSQALSERNIRDSGGALMSLSSEKKVLAVGQLDNPLDVKDIVLRSAGPGNEVLVGDIATVLPGYEPWNLMVLSDGSLALKLVIKKKSSADLLTVTKTLREFLDKEQEVAPPGVEIRIIGDSSRVTLRMLDTLMSNAWMGLLSVFVILTLFFGRHLAFWVSLGLPFSILACFYFLQYTPHTINIMSLMAVVLMLGILVDDAIVTAECIQRYRELGYSAHNAAIEGTMAVGAPVLVSVLTTMLAFVPLFFLGGAEGQYVAVIPTIVVLMLAASLFQSKFILPNHLARAKLEIKSPGWMERSSKHYDRLIRFLLAHRVKSLLILSCAFLVLFLISGSFLRFEMHPESATDVVNIQTEMSTGTPFKDNVARTQQLQQQLRERLDPGDVKSIVSLVGHHDSDPYGSSDGMNESWALTTVNLHHRDTMATTPKQALQLIKTIGAEQKDYSMIYVSAASGAPVLGKAAELEIMSENDDRFSVAEDVAAFLQRQPGVVRVWDSRVVGKDALDLEFNYGKLAAYGLTVKQVADALRVAMDGLIIAEQQTAAERVYFRLKMQHSEQPSMSELRDMFIINARGEAVALRSVAEFKLAPGDSDIKHYAGRRTVTVFADIDRQVTDVISVNAALETFVRDYQVNHTIPHISFYQGGEIEQQQESMGDLLIAFVTCLLLSFFILVLLFNSYSQPLIVLAVLPFGVVGVVLAFAIQDIPMSFLAMIGLLGLVGVLLNNSVVLIHTLNTGKRHINTDAIARRSVTRFRPIVITSLTTLVGLVPAAYGWGGAEPLMPPMVMAMVWGVLFGTLVSLLMLPCLFAVNQDLRRWIGEKFGASSVKTSRRH